VSDVGQVAQPSKTNATPATTPSERNTPSHHKTSGLIVSPPSLVTAWEESKSRTKAGDERNRAVIPFLRAECLGSFAATV
jgi:hypothetical protein